MGAAGFEPEAVGPGRSFRSLPGLRLPGFKSFADTSGSSRPLIHDVMVAVMAGSGTTADITDAIYIHPALSEVVQSAFADLP